MVTIAAPVTTLAETLRTRRQRLAEAIEFPAILWAGQSRSRNFPANTYPFRASSHFLYFGGLALEDAAVRLENGKLHLFLDEDTPASALWHGPRPTREEIAAEMGADRASPLAELPNWTAEAATIVAPDPATQAQQCRWLGRTIAPAPESHGRDRQLAQAIVELRSGHDAAALAEIRRAIAVSVTAHKAGMAATKFAKTEAEIRAAMEAVILAHNFTCAYSSIVTVQGEVLHNTHYYHAIAAGDLLLADVGAETPQGWAADLTRTWPVSGRFSPTQRDVYQVVLAAHDQAIAALRSGVEYREIHLLAARTIAEGLVDLGILRGQPQDLVDRDAHALFFPHGIGHLLGLDVHDMEDLGDLAGYAEGRSRSDRFGLGYLRLDRPLQAGMVVTIEPGFYQVPAILNDRDRREQYREMVNWERLGQFADVRGIRIEDDVLITATGAEVLSAALPTEVAAIEELAQAGP